MKPNDRIGDYEILSELGRGGMGRVYKVRNMISDRVEAMKILLPDLAGRQELVARFLREIKLVASLDHPNIGALRTALTLDGQLVMIMEYVEGTSLAERLENGPLPVAEVLTYAGQALQALSHAHKHGVVHRDIKPANLMITPEGVLKVMDFGIAFSGSEHKLTSTGTTLGSLAYMSPEQVRGEAADLRSDLYSLGISLYEMVTGQRPFKADSDYAIMAAHVKEVPRPPVEWQPGLPASLNSIILLAIAKEKEGRFQSADAFRNALCNVEAPNMQQTSVRTATFVASAPTPLPAPARPSATAYSHPATSAVSAAPAASIPPPPPPAARSGNRGLYMALGAFLALALLVAAGSYYKSGAARSAQESAPAASTEKKAEPAPATPVAETPAAQAPTTPAPTVAETAPSGPPPAKQPATPAPAPTKQAAPPAPAPDNAAEKAAAAAAKAKAAAEAAALLDELETQVDQLTSRALSVDTGLETLRQQQRRAGYDLRGDITAKQEAMKNNLAKARQALEKNDVARGKKFADMTETVLGQLEKFLGR